MTSRAITMAATGLIAVAAGVAIAGLPTSAPDPVVIVPGTVTTTTTLPRPAPAPSESITDDGPNSDDAAREPDAALAERGSLTVGIANASGSPDRLGSTVDVLRQFGYEQTVVLAAADPLEATTVFHQPGFEAEATRLALDAGSSAGDIAPIDIAPIDIAPIDAADVPLTGGLQLLLIVGADAG